MVMACSVAQVSALPLQEAHLTGAHQLGEYLSIKSVKLRWLHPCSTAWTLPQFSHLHHAAHVIHRASISTDSSGQVFQEDHCIQKLEADEHVLCEIKSNEVSCREADQNSRSNVLFQDMPVLQSPS